MRRIEDLLREAKEAQASDVHIAPGRPPYFRIDGILEPVTQEDLTVEEAASLVKELLADNEYARKKYEAKQQTDLSFVIQDGTRFRVNIYAFESKEAAALRVIPSEIRTIEQLNMPSHVLQFADIKQGFLVVTGPTGEGKSSTLAAIIDYINQNRREHIITIEDPIEYLFTEKQSIIDQREVGRDAVSFAEAIRATLRQDIDVVLIGEMRDKESMQTALTLAETGHLVLTTLHTNNAAQTVERIIDSFPGNEQPQIRSQLADTISGVISQRLLLAEDGGRIPAVEIMIANTAIRNAIREANTHQIKGMIQTGAELGMQTIEASIQSLIENGAVSQDEAKRYLSLDETSRAEKGKSAT